MPRLMLVTFAMLGWFFYVMSGGADFEPRNIRADAPASVASAENKAPAQHPARTPIVSTSVDALVTTVAAKPAKPAEPKSEPSPAVEAIDTHAALTQVAAGLNADLGNIGDQGVTFSLASLDQGAATLPLTIPEPVEGTAVSSAVTERQLDIREVSGTRVNLRDGPGTIYPIVGKARMGQKVEVLGDSGTGWLRLRVFPEQQLGWVSASLIRKSAK